MAKVNAYLRRLGSTPPPVHSAWSTLTHPLGLSSCHFFEGASLTHPRSHSMYFPSSIVIQLILMHLGDCLYYYRFNQQILIEPQTVLSSGDTMRHRPTRMELTA